MYGTRTIPNINKERTNASTTTLMVSYTFAEDLGFSVILPYQTILNEKVLFRGQYKHQYDGGKYFRETHGFGDIIFMLSKRFTTPFSLTVTGGFKLSNGNINAVDIYDQRFSDNLQISTGTVDPIFAVYSDRTIGPLVASGGVYTRIVLRENIYGYRYGNELNVVSELHYNQNELWFAGIQGHYLLTTRDSYQYGKIARERGGKWLYINPKFGIKLTEEFHVETQLTFPVYQNVNESQLTSKSALTVTGSYHWN